MARRVCSSRPGGSRADDSDASRCRSRKRKSERKREESEKKNREGEHSIRTYSDKIDNERIKEPVHELAQQLEPLVHVCSSTALLLARSCLGRAFRGGEPLAIEDREALQERVERDRLVASVTEELRDVYGGT